jgi:ribonuclease III
MILNGSRGLTNVASFNTLEQKLGYKFANPKLLELALKHRSLGRNSNERLEFLGDAVLSLVITVELFNRYPKYYEGELSRLRSNLVKKEALADLAKNFKLNEYLLVGESEKKSGGLNRSSIAVDAIEAIIGAIYLDSNIEICGQKILEWYGDRLSGLTPVGQKDPKTELQEYLQARKMALPIYQITATEGKMHAQIFHVSCRVEGLSIVTQGSANNKQEAEQIAARKFLVELKNRHSAT